jgi:5-methylcytosine-specific restriction protein A
MVRGGGTVAWGEPWSIEELSAAVAAYDEMLELQLAGQPYVKARIREQYLDGPLSGRTKRSFEERMGNISAVRQQMGLPIITGYKPKEHVGDVRTEQIKEIIGSSR